MNEEKLMLYGIYVIEDQVQLQQAHYILDQNKKMLMMYYDGGDRNSRMPGYVYLEQVDPHQRLAKTPEQAVSKFVKHQEALIALAKNLIM